MQITLWLMPTWLLCCHLVERVDILLSTDVKNFFYFQTSFSILLINFIFHIILNNFFKVFLIFSFLIENIYYFSFLIEYVTSIEKVVSFYKLMIDLFLKYCKFFKGEFEKITEKINLNQRNSNWTNNLCI